MTKNSVFALQIIGLILSLYLIVFGFVFVLSCWQYVLALTVGIMFGATLYDVLKAAVKIAL